MVVLLGSLRPGGRSQQERMQSACESEYEDVVFDAERAETYAADTFDEAIAECVAELEGMSPNQRDLIISAYNGN